jgi:predicted Fe-Mo cluster-binding NifX family protein
MKVAVSARGRDLSSMLDPRFGRAPYLIIYDTESNAFEVIDNTSAGQMAHGAGIQTAQEVVNQRADLVVSGNFGPKACQVLQAANVKLAMSPETSISEVLELVRSEKLTAFTG